MTDADLLELGGQFISAWVLGWVSGLLMRVFHQVVEKF